LKAPSANFVFPDFVIYVVMILTCVAGVFIRRHLHAPLEDLTREYERREAQRAAEARDAAASAEDDDSS
jgi:hypothetical protein